MYEISGDSSRLWVASGRDGIFGDIVSASPTPLDVVFVAFAVEDLFS